MALVCLLIAVLPSSADADALFTYGFTPRGIGMGGAMAATADDYAAAYYNPAGGAFQTRPSLGLGYMVTGSQLQGIDIEAPELEHTQGLIFGTTLPLPFGSFLEERVALNLGIFLPNGMLLGIQVPQENDPQYILLENAGRSLSLIPTLSVRVLRGLAVGGGVQLFDNTSGELNATIEPDGTIQATVGQELPTSFAATAGVLFRFGDYWPRLNGLRTGLVFRDRFFTRYDIPVNTAIGDTPLLVSFKATSLYTPRQYVWGAACQTGRWLWALDLSYNEWSDFPDPNLQIEVDIDIPLLPIEFQDSQSSPPHFHDTLTTRAGLEVQAYQGANIDWFTRAGYSFDPSPVPPQTNSTNYLDADRHLFGCSFGWLLHHFGAYRFELPLLWDLAGQAQYLPPRSAYKHATVDPDNPGHPRVGFTGWLFAGALTVSFRFDYE